MFKLLKGGRVFTPENLGTKDLLIAGDKIAQIGEINPVPEYGPVEVIDVTDHYVVPGFIDQHIHLIGGGGEAGYASRTPEVRLSQLTSAGITTVVGCLGTDGTTRHMASLLAKARGLENEGISTYIYTGSYEIPTCTLMKNVRDDLIIIDKVIGCGEVAISDHRSAQPTKEDISKLAAECRVGGILSGKAGVLHLHVGSGKEGLRILSEIVDETNIPITQFIPTHINRNADLLAEGIRFAQKGGRIDLTTGFNPLSQPRTSISPTEAIHQALAEGAPLEQITMSSDGNGSLPVFNERGDIVGMTVSEPRCLYEEFKNLVNSGLPLEDSLKVITQNPARVLKIQERKGTLRVWADADVLVLDQDLNIVHVYARGQCMIRDGKILVSGTFE
ncbi:beta-aspartyl-peptidase [Desulfosporosinus sp. FKB]|uniref:beta-aspartyl-peptidase n=1 Tax=Desulfosporosinus sp. FKB TaxID=1969835 RepID=UPI000B49E8C9|nr:beta-aspartyl-peptidase [Desulfosporosinus sp. FKB]